MKKAIALAAAALLALALFAGCGGAASGENRAGASSPGNAASTENASLRFSGTTVTARVTAIDGKDLTVSLVSFPRGSAASGAAAGEGTTPPSGGAPESPGSGTGAPVSPGSGGRGAAGGAGGQFAGSGGLAATLTINNESILIKDGSQAALSDIQTGDTLVIAYGDDGQIENVTIQSGAGTGVPASNSPDGQTSPDVSGGQASPSVSA